MVSRFPSLELLISQCVLWVVIPSRVPANVKFEIDDMELEWTFPDNQFDFIHMRSLSGSIKDWDHLLSQAYEWVPRIGHTCYFPF